MADMEVVKVADKVADMVAEAMNSKGHLFCDWLTDLQYVTEVSQTQPEQLKITQIHMVCRFPIIFPPDLPESGRPNSPV